MQFQSIENRCSRIIFLADEKLQVSVLLGDIGVNLDNIGDGIRRHINGGRNSRTDYIRARAAARIAAQKSNEEFSAACDYTLENDGTQAEFRRKCRTLFETLI